MDAKTDAGFVVMARTDALSVDGFNAVVDRAAAFAEAGADAFAEAMIDIDTKQLLQRLVCRCWQT